MVRPPPVPTGVVVVGIAGVVEVVDVVGAVVVAVVVDVVVVGGAVVDVVVVTGVVTAVVITGAGVGVVVVSGGTVVVTGVVVGGIVVVVAGAPPPPPPPPAGVVVTTVPVIITVTLEETTREVLSFPVPLTSILPLYVPFPSIDVSVRFIRPVVAPTWITDGLTLIGTPTGVNLIVPSHPKNWNPIVLDPFSGIVIENALGVTPIEEVSAGAGMSRLIITNAAKIIYSFFIMISPC